MSTNAELIERFQRMAAVLQLLGANRFRVNAYEKGARALEGLGFDIADIADDPKNLTEIEGIGQGLAEKIVEYVQTGHIEEVDEALDKVPPGVLELVNVPSIGPKTAKAMWEQLGITSLAELRQALDDGRLEQLPRMGAKTIDNIRKSIDFAETAGRRVNIADALPVAERIVDQLRRVEGVTRCDYAGSLRRGRETIGDIDILAGCDDPPNEGQRIGDTFANHPDVADVILSGPTKTSVRLAGGMQVDLRVIDHRRYGAALLYFTGSKQHNVLLRERSLKHKRHLNEYGLWAGEADADNPEAEPLAADTEQAIYETLDLDWIPPELREDRGEIDAAAHHRLPKLIETTDIKAELHAHTTASDGTWSIRQLAEAAKARGYHTVAVTDHSKSSVIANGLSENRLREHIDAIRKANKSVQGIRILAGSEVDIHPDGSLDYPDDLLAQLDIVVASPHHSLQQNPDKATQRLLAAIHNPYVHIIGHPTGRMINKREGISPDMRKIIHAAAETHTALEINAHHLRLDLNDTNARAAIDAGATLAINCDAHAPDHLDELRFGILTARRAWATPDHVINCLPKTKLDRWLKHKRKHMGVA